MEITPSVTVCGNEIENHGGIKGKIYICIDLFVIPAAREEVSPTPTIKANLDILDDEDKGVLDKGGLLVVSFGSVYHLWDYILQSQSTYVVAKREANMDMHQDNTPV